MKRPTKKKASARKGRPRSEDRPLEFDRSWHELETRHDRIKCDWMSLAAQLKVSAKDRF